jgi:hypothetical protein
MVVAAEATVGGRAVKIKWSYSKCDYVFIVIMLNVIKWLMLSVTYCDHIL